MPPLPRLTPPEMTPPARISLSINNEIVHVKGESFFTTQDTGVLQDCVRLNPQDAHSPLFIPRPSARPYTFVANWLETNRLPKNLSEDALKEIAIEADYLDMPYLYREASVLYPFRLQIEKQAPGSVSRCLAIANYADLLHFLDEKTASRQWFCKARQEAPEASMWLRRYYQKEVEKETTEVLPFLRFATLNFSVKSDEYCGPVDATSVVRILEDVLLENPGDKQAIAYITQISQRRGTDTRAVGLLLGDELRLALEFAPKDTFYQLCCLAGCRSTPTNKHLLAQLSESEEEPEPPRRNIFSLFYQAISSEVRAHPLAHYLKAENSLFSSSLRLTQADIFNLIDSATKLERSRDSSDPTSSIVPRSRTTASVRHAMIRLLCTRGPLDVQQIRAASTFCLTHADNNLEEFKLQKFLLLVAGDMVGVWNAALLAGLNFEERSLLNLELIYRSNGGNIETQQQVLRGLYNTTQERGASNRGIVSHLCALTLLHQEASPNDSSLIFLLRHLDSLPGGFSASSLLRVLQCKSVSEMILSIEAQKVGSLTYFLLHQEADKFPIEKRAWIERRHEVLLSRLDIGVENPKLLRDLAWSFFHLGQYTQALEALDVEQGHFLGEMAGRPVRALCLHFLGRTADASAYLLRTQYATAGALPEEASLLDYLRQMYVHVTVGLEPAFALAMMDSLRKMPAHDILAQEIFLVRCRTFRVGLESDAT